MEEEGSRRRSGESKASKKEIDLEVTLAQLVEALLQQGKEPRTTRTKRKVEEEDPHEESYKEDLPWEYNGMRRSGVLKRWLNEMECCLEHC